MAKHENSICFYPVAMRKRPEGPQYGLCLNRMALQVEPERAGLVYTLFQEEGWNSRMNSMYVEGTSYNLSSPCWVPLIFMFKFQIFLETWVLLILISIVSLCLGDCYCSIKSYSSILCMLQQHTFACCTLFPSPFVPACYGKQIYFI